LRKPKLYEYFGIIILFYSNEHEPIHVHGKYQGTESRAEIIIDNGEIVEIRSQDSMTLPDGAVIDIEEVRYVDGYKLYLIFSDKKERTIDFEPFLSNSLNSMIRRYLNLDDFKRFTVEYGDLFWNDYDLCFPIADLYEGRI
jgi:hypothetical protein